MAEAGDGSGFVASRLGDDSALVGVEATDSVGDEVEAVLAAAPAEAAVVVAGVVVVVLGVVVGVEVVEDGRGADGRGGAAVSEAERVACCSRRASRCSFMAARRAWKSSLADMVVVERYRGWHTRRHAGNRSSLMPRERTRQIERARASNTH